ncbi:hypothetical protein HK100_005256, partial [Physocladia obscura]
MNSGATGNFVIQGGTNKPSTQFEDEDEYNRRIRRTGCLAQHNAMLDCHYETKDWRKCIPEMKQFRQCFEQHDRTRQQRSVVDRARESVIVERGADGNPILNNRGANEVCELPDAKWMEFPMQPLIVQPSTSSASSSEPLIASSTSTSPSSELLHPQKPPSPIHQQQERQPPSLILIDRDYSVPNPTTETIATARPRSRNPEVPYFTADASALPDELTTRIAAPRIVQTITAINAILAEGAVVSRSSVVKAIVEFFFFVSIKSDYEKMLERLAVFIEAENKEIYEVAGLYLR